jgi:hypothetical protein
MLPLHPVLLLGNQTLLLAMQCKLHASLLLLLPASCMHHCYCYQRHQQASKLCSPRHCHCLHLSSSSCVQSPRQRLLLLLLLLLLCLLLPFLQRAWLVMVLTCFWHLPSLVVVLLLLLLLAD